MGDPITAGLIIGGVLGTASVVEARKSRKDAARARKVQERSNRLQSGRQAVEQVRQAQIARADVIQSGENQGVGGSSAVIGGAGSVQSQAGSNIGFAQQLFNLQQSARRLQDSAALHAGNSQGFATFASLAANSNFGSSTPAPVETATPDFVRSN